jgi:hypothetical protein
MTIDNLNFDRADFTAETREDHCAWCTRGLNGSYFDVQSNRVCATCAERARRVSPEDTRATFLRSVLFGSLAAAMVGMAYFALFRMTDGMWMVFASIGVGYVIGKAMRMGSNGVGGRRYQVMAALLTYIAVTVASSAAILGTADLPVWGYPFLMFVPIVNLFLHRIGLGALQILFVLAGARWAWLLMAGTPWRITGPHSLAQ